MAFNNVVPVILCGGAGSRLWPLTQDKPKHFLNLIDGFSLLQNTATRAVRITGAKNIVLVTLRTMEAEALAHMEALNLPTRVHIVTEPCAKNTAAAVALAVRHVEQVFGAEALMWILPADHYMGNENALAAAVMESEDIARNGMIVTFGITPSRPETGYGYIKAGGKIKRGTIHAVDLFVEKPDGARASAYLRAGNFFWNSGMVLVKAHAVLEEFMRHAPEFLANAYDNLSPLPFDKAILERSKRVVVTPCDPDWSDIGSWEGLWEIWRKDLKSNPARIEMLESALLTARRDGQKAIADVLDSFKTSIQLS